MFRRASISVVAVGVLVVALSACSSGGEVSGAGVPSKDGAFSVVTTTNVYASVVKEIGGRFVEVKPLIDSTAQDPHSYEATARDRLAVQNADLVVLNGGGYDDFMTTLVDASGKGSDAVVDAVAVSGLEGAEEASHDHDNQTEHSEHDHGDFNEHVWYSLSAMRNLGSVIAEKLSALDSAHTADFAANKANFVESIDRLQAQVQKMRAPFSGKAVAETEPVSAYLLEDAGLQNRSPREFVAAVENQQEVSPALMRNMSEVLDAKSVLALVINSQVSTPQIEQLAQKARSLNTPVLAFGETIEGELTYSEWMGANITRLAAIQPQN